MKSAYKKLKSAYKKLKSAYKKLKSAYKTHTFCGNGAPQFSCEYCEISKNTFS